MGNPVIWWPGANDHLRIRPLTTGAAGTLGSVYPNITRSNGTSTTFNYDTTGNGVINLTIPISNRSGNDLYNTLDILTSGRSVDSTLDPWSYVIEYNTANKPYALYVAIIIIGSNLDLQFAESTSQPGAPNITTTTPEPYPRHVGSSSVNLLPTTLNFIYTYPRFFIGKSNLGRVHDIMVTSIGGTDTSSSPSYLQEQRILLDKPPQSSAYPAITREWKTYPSTSQSGHYLGSAYRRRTGTIDCSITDLPTAEVETRWEPFREHLAKGGMCAYQIDRDVRDSPIAYCYATSAPAPKIKAGGFADIKLQLAVVDITP